MVQPLWKSVWRFLRKLDMRLPENPAIPLLGIYLKDSPAYSKDTCSIMFIAALFIISNIYKELKKLDPREPNDPIKKWGTDLNKEFSPEEIRMAKRHLKKFSTSLVIS